MVWRLRTYAWRPSWALIRKNDRIVIHGNRRTRGIPKRTWIQAITKDTIEVNLIIAMVFSQAE